MPILSTSNSKLEKGELSGYRTSHIRLAPGDKSGYEVCQNRTKDCLKYCVSESGNGNFPNVKKAAITRTVMLFEEREYFMAQLDHELNGQLLKDKRDGFKTACRPNAFSDVKWEEIRDANGLNLFERFPQITFYDYTKHLFRDRTEYENYTLTFSFNGFNHNRCLQYLRMGRNVAVPYQDKFMPEMFLGFETCDGDVNDLRFLDPSPRAVMLSAKGKLQGKDTPFLWEAPRALSEVRTRSETY